MATDDSLFTWSNRARQDFDTVTDDGQSSDKFKLALARTIALGWDGNRDKPVWALCSLLGALTESEFALSTCLDFLWPPSGDIIACLATADHRAIRRNDDGGLFLTGVGGSFKIDRFRVRLLQKYLEFIVTCDEFTFGEPVAKLLDPILQSGLDEQAAIDEAVRGIARCLYRYRADHFDDGHATSAFSILRAFTKSRGDTLEDDSVLEFWTSAENQHYRTYAASFFAFKDYADALTAARERVRFVQADDIAQPGLQGELSVDFVDPFEADALEEDAFEAVTADATAEPNDPRDTSSEVAALAAIDAADVKIYKKKEVAFLSPIMQASRFGVSLPLATARLLTFHPIQSALSNQLRTGKAILPAAERVLCGEARPYAGLVADLTEMETAMKDWLKIAVALRRADDDENERAEAMRAEGVVLLRQKRSKSFDRAPEDLSAAFARLETALLTVTETLRDYARSCRACFDAEGGPERPFAADVQRFAEAFTLLYVDNGGEQTAREA